MKIFQEILELPDIVYQNKSKKLPKKPILQLDS